MQQQHHNLLMSEQGLKNMSKYNHKKWWQRFAFSIIYRPCRIHFLMSNFLSETFSVSMYSSLVQLSAGPTVLFLPFLNGSVTRAVTPGLMTQHHAIICVHLRSPCYPPLFPLSSFFLLASPFFLPPPHPSHSTSTFPPPYLCLGFFSSLFCLFPLFSRLLLALYVPLPSPPPPCAMSKACQSKPSRQNCHYCSW